MLKLMRNFVTSWVGMLVLALAVGSMAIVFGQSGSMSGGGSEREIVLATIGKQAITDRQYMAAVERIVSREREENPDLDIPTFLQSGGGDMVLQQMIVSEALKLFASQNGVTVSKRLVDGEIASIPAFQVNGEFNEDNFRRLIAEQNISEGELRDSIAQDVVRRQLLQPVIAGMRLPDSAAQHYARMLLEQRAGQILAIPSMLMPDPGKPTDAQLDAFYKKHADAYTIPERRAFRYADISAAGLTDRAKPDAAEVRKYYDDNPGEFGGLETRDVQQIMLPDMDAAKAFVARLEGGTPFVAAAREKGFSAADVTITAASKDDLTKRLDADAADAAFALAAKAVSEPLPSGFGVRVIQINAVHPPRAQPFASVAEQITAELTQERLLDLLADMVNDAEDRLDEGQSLADVAQTLSLAVQTEAPVTRDGRRFDAEYQMTSVDLPVAARVFELSSEEGPRVIEVDEGHYALVEVMDVVRPTLVPLDHVRNELMLHWSLDARSAEARKVADGIAKALDDGQSLNSALAGRRLPPVENLTVRRLELTQMLSQNQPVPPPVLTLLNIPEGKTKVVAAPDEQGWFVVRVDKVTAGSDEEITPLADGLRQALGRDAGNELAEAFIRTVERSAKVVRRPEAVQAVNARMSGVYED